MLHAHLSWVGVPRHGPMVPMHQQVWTIVKPFHKTGSKSFKSQHRLGNFFRLLQWNPLWQSVTRFPSKGKAHSCETRTLEKACNLAINQVNAIRDLLPRKTSIVQMKSDEYKWGMQIVEIVEIDRYRLYRLKSISCPKTISCVHAFPPVRKAATSLETCCAPPHVLHTGTESAGTLSRHQRESNIEFHDSNIFKHHSCPEPPTTSHNTQTTHNKTPMAYHDWKGLQTQLRTRSNSSCFFPVFATPWFLSHSFKTATVSLSASPQPSWQTPAAQMHE